MHAKDCLLMVHLFQKKPRVSLAVTCKHFNKMSPLPLCMCQSLCPLANTGSPMNGDGSFPCSPDPMHHPRVLKLEDGWDLKAREALAKHPLGNDLPFPSPVGQLVQQ